MRRKLQTNKEGEIVGENQQTLEGDQLKNLTPVELAKQAMSKRAKKQSDKMQQHYTVIAVFCGICLLAIFYTIFSPKQKFSEMKVIDDSLIFVHNGQGHQFKHGRNQIFENKTIADLKTMFYSGLSDSNQINPCKSSKAQSEKQLSEEEEIDVPESYDWRQVYPQCVQEVQSIGVGKNCSSSYAMITLSAVADRICMKSNQTVRLSTQEIIDCDVNSYNCEGGYVNKVLNFGKKNGYILEECMDYTGKSKECDIDHFESNQCRVENLIYRLNDYCIAVQDVNIKRELKKNGPVISQIVVNTDFLAYKEGSYHKTQESFKFNGYHIVKIVGWQKSIDGGTEWIVENTWGSDWGENGYVRMIGGRGDTGIDMYALGAIPYPYTLYDYSSMENMRNSAMEAQEENYTNQNSQQSQQSQYTQQEPSVEEEDLYQEQEEL